MAKRKLEKFAAIGTFPNVVQNFSFFHPQLIDHNGKEISLRGKWKEDFFHNQNKIILELACGKGEYTVEMARTMPDKNFIGIDIKGNRLYTGAQTASEEKITNAAFLRTDINLLPHFFGKDEVSEIWITFPDPYLQNAKSSKRLTSPRFLNMYKQFLQHGGMIHLKTDDTSLYEFTLSVIRENNYALLYADDDIYSKDLMHPFLQIRTYYEKMHLAAGKKIRYIRFSLQ